MKKEKAKKILLILAIILIMLIAIILYKGILTGNIILNDPIKEYIIELEYPPVAEEIDRIAALSSATSEDYIQYDSSAISSYTERITEAHNNIEQKIQQKLGKTIIDKSNEYQTAPFNSVLSYTSGENSGQVIKISEYERVINGFAMKMTASDAEKVKTISGIKRVTEALPVKPILYETRNIIGAAEVWKLSDSQGNKIKGKGTIIAVLDTGVDYTHAMFGRCTSTQFKEGNCAKVIGGYDFGGIDGTKGDKNPIDKVGHGTSVASIAAGSAIITGITFIAGMAPEAKILAYKVFDDKGKGNNRMTLDALERILDSTSPEINKYGKPDVIIMSLGTDCGGDYYEFCGPDDPLSRAVDNVVRENIVVVVAAGNCGPQGEADKCAVLRDRETVTSPGTARKAITVGGTSKQDAIGGYSSRGHVRDGTTLVLKPEIVAPGSNMKAAHLGNKIVTYEGGGTSFAAPHLAGTALLLKQQHPTWKAETIKSVLISTTKNIKTPIRQQGYGRVNALNAANYKGGVPKVQINAIKPLNSQTVGTPFDIKGTVSGGNIVSWTLYYNKGDSSPAWVKLKDSTTTVKSDVLYKGFNANALPNNAGQLPEGYSYLKLTAKNDKNSFINYIIPIYVKRT